MSMCFMYVKWLCQNIFELHQKYIQISDIMTVVITLYCKYRTMEIAIAHKWLSKSKNIRSLNEPIFPFT